jgi:hypothetical protein
MSTLATRSIFGISNKKAMFSQPRDCVVPQPKVFGHVVIAFCGIRWLRARRQPQFGTRADAVEIAVVYDTDTDHPIDPPFRELWELARPTAAPEPCVESNGRAKKE